MNIDKKLRSFYRSQVENTDVKTNIQEKIRLAMPFHPRRVWFGKWVASVATLAVGMCLIAMLLLAPKTSALAKVIETHYEPEKFVQVVEKLRSFVGGIQ